MKKKKYQQPDVLIAILKYKDDLNYLLNQGWYRIPKKTAPKLLKKFLYLAFYQPACFEEEKYKIRYYGRVEKISIVKRIELLPEEVDNPNSLKPYYKIEMKDIRELKKPIISKKGRMLVFVPTTIEKLLYAEEINDCFHGSPLEDLLWRRFKNEKIKAERDLLIKNIKENKKIQLDFALFCNKGKLNIECDGDAYHIGKENAVRDNKRDNYLTSVGWNILRFSTKQLSNNLDQSINIIKETIKNLN